MDRLSLPSGFLLTDTKCAGSSKKDRHEKGMRENEASKEATF